MVKPTGERGFLLAELGIFLLLLSLLLLFLFALGLSAQRLQAQSGLDFTDEQALWSAQRLVSSAVHSAVNISLQGDSVLNVNQGGSQVTIGVYSGNLVEKDSNNLVLATVSGIDSVSFATYALTGGTYLLSTVSPPSSSSNLTTPAPLAEGSTLWLVSPGGGQGAGPLTITTTSLPNAIYGQPYRATLSATGGIGSYTWSATGLPDGLSMGSNGLISGTPTSAALTSQVTITVLDTAKNSASRNFTLTVPLTITTTSLPIATYGQLYSATLAAVGGTHPYTWTATGLPDGLSMSSNGVISGTPSAAGTSTVNITVTDSANDSASLSLSLTVYVPPLTITTSSLPDGMVLAPYRTALSAAGGIGFDTWTASGLPLGLKISSGGVISGTPLWPGTWMVQVKVTDSAAHTASHSFNLTVNPSLWILTWVLPDGMVGTSYSASLTAIGGTGSYTWSATGLPAGLSLNPDGVISGKPTAAGTSTVNITVTDSANDSASLSLRLTVYAPPLTITTSSLPSGMVGAAYNATLAATGGTGSYTWSASGLPLGLKISSGGVIIGTPLWPGTWTVQVKVTDSAAHTASHSFSLTVNPSLWILTLSLPVGTVGTSYSATLTAIGGTGSYTWSATGLPSGLSLSPDGVISGKPSAAGISTVNITVTDSANDSASLRLSLTVYPALTITTSSLPTGMVGSEYSTILAATGGSGSYTWSATGLPSGLSLSREGVISGKPSAVGTLTVNVTVQDTANNTASKSYSLTVYPKLTITTTDLPDATEDSSYSFSLNAAGGDPPYNWSWSANKLPDGLTLSSDGVISGTPTKNEDYPNITITVSDSANNSATATFNLKVHKKDHD